MRQLRTIDLFAGVGGFRIGLERVSDGRFKTIWSNQYEPSTKKQHASETYVARFGADGHVNEDITLVKTSDIPDFDVLCAGFPCQDYSVARNLGQSNGIEGKKGVLWWEIERIVREKGENSPEILFLENVDRLLISPSKQRGRDFAIILKSLDKLGYTVEWRVINSAEYGMPQRRKRIYILAYKRNSIIDRSILDLKDWILQDGVLAKAFPAKADNDTLSYITSIGHTSILDISDGFNANNKTKPFLNSGIMKDGITVTVNTKPDYVGQFKTLGDILANGDDRNLITEDFYIQDSDLDKWKYLKGAKHETRKTKDGFEFVYSEGSMSFPDPLDKPSRTIITSEGGNTPSRFKHVIEDPVNHRLRRLIPLELERLNMFPDNHTKGQKDTKRAFFMGNALVCGVITKIGEEISKRYD